MIQRTLRSTQSRRRQRQMCIRDRSPSMDGQECPSYKTITISRIGRTFLSVPIDGRTGMFVLQDLSLIHISEPTRLGMISYAVFCLKKKKHGGKTHTGAQ